MRSLKNSIFSVFVLKFFYSLTFKFMQISDENLYQLCQQYGRHALLWRQKFIGLLPEVYKRGLYKKKNFGSIFEFAKKLAGVSEEQVRVTLNLEERFKDKPALHTLLVNGITSVHKLARVVSIATPENEAVLANQVQLLSKKSLEALVRDERAESKSLPGQTLHLADDIHKELLELQQKGIDTNDLLRTFLAQRRQKIAQEKEALSAESQPTISRYIPVQIRQVITEEHGTKCTIKTCSRPAQIIHHTQRFALSKTHDPHFLAPLCKEHHMIAHAIDVKVHSMKRMLL